MRLLGLPLPTPGHEGRAATYLSKVNRGHVQVTQPCRALAEVGSVGGCWGQELSVCQGTPVAAPSSSLAHRVPRPHLWEGTLARGRDSATWEEKTGGGGSRVQGQPWPLGACPGFNPWHWKERGREGGPRPEPPQSQPRGAFPVATAASRRARPTSLLPAPGRPPPSTGLQPSRFWALVRAGAVACPGLLAAMLAALSRSNH